MLVVYICLFMFGHIRTPRFLSKTINLHDGFTNEKSLNSWICIEYYSFNKLN